MKIAFTVPGPPVPKQRARMGKGGRWYTPKETAEYRHRIRNAMTASWFRTTAWPINAAYRVSLLVYMQDARRRDVDNIAKAVLDALNSITWDDDSRVQQLAIDRSIDRKQPRVEVVIEVIEKKDEEE